MLGQANLWLRELHTACSRPPFDSPQRQRHGLLLLRIRLGKGGAPVGARGCNVLTRAHLPWAEPEVGNGGSSRQQSPSKCVQPVAPPMHRQTSIMQQYDVGVQAHRQQGC